MPLRRRGYQPATTRVPASAFAAYCRRIVTVPVCQPAAARRYG
jgi:hypothetical protein